ncbi:MAG: twin-arginine translocase TatA/TatE family subunit [Methylocella sp.]
MFDFDAGKLILIGIVALIVIGPKELPRVLRQVGQAAAKMRRMAAEFRGQFMDAMREADIEEIKADADKLAKSAIIDAGFNPLADIKAGITSALEGTDKPAALPLAETPAIAAPGSSDSALNSIALPRLPEVLEGGSETFLAEGIAPWSRKPGADRFPPVRHRPPTPRPRCRRLPLRLRLSWGRPRLHARKLNRRRCKIRSDWSGRSGSATQSMFRKS